MVKQPRTADHTTSIIRIIKQHFLLQPSHLLPLHNPSYFTNRFLHLLWLLLLPLVLLTQRIVVIRIKSLLLSAAKLDKLSQLPWIILISGGGGWRGCACTYLRYCGIITWGGLVFSLTCVVGTRKGDCIKGGLRGWNGKMFAGVWDLRIIAKDMTLRWLVPLGRSHNSQKNQSSFAITLTHLKATHFQWVEWTPPQSAAIWHAISSALARNNPHETDKSHSSLTCLLR